jgi:dTMP kinase
MTPTGQAAPARFVVLEGLDGSGTTTQAGLVAQALRTRGLRVTETAEPTEGPLGRILRAHVRGELTLDPPTAALAFTADRADHLARVIRPALARGEWVVCDRYLLSTLAYQGAEGVDRRWILDASAGFEVPDLTVFLEVPEPELARRLGKRPRADRYEGAETTRAVLASYEESIELLRRAGHSVEVVDGCARPQDITSDVLARLDALGPDRIYP